MIRTEWDERIRMIIFLAWQGYLPTKGELEEKLREYDLTKLYEKHKEDVLLMKSGEIIIA